MPRVIRAVPGDGIYNVPMTLCVYSYEPIDAHITILPLKGNTTWFEFELGVANSVRMGLAAVFITRRANGMIQLSYHDFHNRVTDQTNASKSFTPPTSTSPIKWKPPFHDPPSHLHLHHPTSLPTNDKTWVLRILQVRAFDRLIPLNAGYEESRCWR